MKLNFVLRAEARQALLGKWGMMIIALLVYYLFLSFVGVSATKEVHWLYPLLTLLVMYPLMYGLCALALDVFRRSDVGVEGLFQGFNNYVHVVLTMLLMNLYIALWSLLLIVPGIVKSYSYAMTPFIMKDNPEYCYDKAIDESMRMMQGYKMKLFLLDLSFVGWILLSILTFGIGFLFLTPYMYVSHAAFYEDIRGQRVGEYYQKVGEYYMKS